MKNSLPNTSGFYNLVGTLIVIDNNWSATASAYNWCYLQDGYYIIENVTLDAMDSGTGITIKNSIDPFIIQNSSISNSSWMNPPNHRGAIFLDNVSNGNILSNDLSNNGMDGIVIQNSFNITVTNNTIDNNFYIGVVSYLSDLITISYNNLSGNEAGLLIEDSSNQKVIENKIINTNWGGIQLNFAHFTYVYKNIIYNHTFSSGIAVYSDNCTISENEINIGGLAGISVRGTYNNITSNIVKNHSTGIKIGQTAPVIKNRIIGNVLANNTAGIYVNRGNNTFFLNYLLHNTLYNVRDESFNFEGIKNDWDNGTIGNYYSDYGGKDTNDDGIGDTQYNIYDRNLVVNGIDRFPIWWDSPVIVINSPNNGDNLEKNPSFDISIVEGVAESTWYSLDNGVSNHTFTGSTGIINQNSWYNLPDGPIQISFYVNDSRGYVGKIQVNIIKNIGIPEITIITPIMGQRFGSQAPEFTITVTDLSSIFSMWYTIDGGVNNFTFTSFMETINSTAWETVLEGEVILIIYAQDELGNVGSESVIIIKSSDIAVPGYYVHLILGTSFLGSVFILKRRYLRIKQ